jgi:hypothetical protein
MTSTFLKTKADKKNQEWFNVHRVQKNDTLKGNKSIIFSFAPETYDLEG